MNPFTLTPDERADCLRQLRADWPTVQEDARLMRAVTLGGEVPTPETVLPYLVRHLSAKLAKAFRATLTRRTDNIEPEELRVQIEPGGSARVEFKGQTRTVKVPGMTRLVGRFTCRGQTVSVFQSWVSRPFWQNRWKAA